MSFNVGDIVKIVDSVSERLVGATGEIVGIGNSIIGYHVRLDDPNLHNYHMQEGPHEGSRAFPDYKLTLYEECIDADISCDEIMSIIGVDL